MWSLLGPTHTHAACPHPITPITPSLASPDVHGVQSVRFLRDRDTGAFRGYGFIEFHTTESATALLHQQRSHPLVLHGARLALAYAKTGGAGGYRGDGYGHRGDYGGPSATSSHGDPPGGDGGSSSHTPKDWVCERCKAINFARRFECFKCCTARPPPESRITVDADAPTNIVKVTGFDAYSTTNEHLYYLAAAVAPVQEVCDVVGMCMGYVCVCVVMLVQSQHDDYAL